MKKIKKYAMTTVAKKRIPVEWMLIEEWNHILDFYDKYWELPFNDFEWKPTNEIIMKFYIEKYRKFKPTFNEFFTPNKLAEKVVEVLSDYVDIKHTYILDAFCWTGQILKYLNPNWSVWFDFNDNFLEINKYFWRKVFKHNAFSLYEKEVKNLSENKYCPMKWQYKAIISNPPFWKYMWTIIDKYLVDFFYNCLEKWGILVLIAPINFIQKQAKNLDNKFIIKNTIEHNIEFDYTKINTSIFVLEKI